MPASTPRRPWRSSRAYWRRFELHTREKTLWLADLVLGLLFLALPFALGFSGLDAASYWLNGAVVVALIGLSKPETDMASA